MLGSMTQKDVPVVFLFLFGGLDTVAIKFPFALSLFVKSRHSTHSVVIRLIIKLITILRTVPQHPANAVAAAIAIIRCHCDSSTLLSPLDSFHSTKAPPACRDHKSIRPIRRELSKASEFVQSIACELRSEDGGGVGGKKKKARVKWRFLDDLLA